MLTYLIFTSYHLRILKQFTRRSKVSFPHRFQLSLLTVICLYLNPSFPSSSSLGLAKTSTESKDSKMEKQPNAMVPEILTEKNYKNWKVWMRNYLLDQGLWDIVDGSELSPADAEPDQFKKWRKNDARALNAIQRSSGPKFFSLIREMDSAKAAWDRLAALLTQQLEEVTPLINQEIITEGNTWCMKLYKAVTGGDWRSTKTILDKHPEVMSRRIPLYEFSALQLAAMYGQAKIVEQMVKMMDAEDLKLPTEKFNSPLHLVASSGFKDVAVAIVERNSDTVCIKGNDNFIPVIRAAIDRNRDMVRYLYSVTPQEGLNPETPQEQLNPETSDINGILLLTAVIDADIYDVAFDLLRRYPRLAIARGMGGATAFEILARKSSAFPSGYNFRFYERWIHATSGSNLQSTCALGYMESDIENNNKSYKEKKHKVSQGLHFWKGQIWKAFELVPGVKKIHSKKLLHDQALQLLKNLCGHLSNLSDSQLEDLDVNKSVFIATRYGNVDFLVEIIRSYPYLLLSLDRIGQTIFHAAIVHRQEKVFNLIYSTGEIMKERLAGADLDGNNMLHLAAMLAHPSQLSKISGAAMQMQRELQWFKEVEGLVPSTFKEDVNSKQKTPRALFTEQHKNLVKDGEEWMKGTASSCMVVAALIATVMFAATFTVPGGINEDTGVPIFLHNNLLIVFVVSEALSLFSSTTSILMFLGILTSRYAEEDFLKSLPKKLIIGLATLFFAIATMMIAFCATVFIILHERLTWVAVPVSTLACVPVTMFALLHFPLFFDIVVSTYGPEGYLILVWESLERRTVNAPTFLQNLFTKKPQSIRKKITLLTSRFLAKESPNNSPKTT